MNVWTKLRRIIDYKIEQSLPDTDYDSGYFDNLVGEEESFAADAPPELQGEKMLWQDPAAPRAWELSPARTPTHNSHDRQTEIESQEPESAIYLSTTRGVRVACHDIMPPNSLPSPGQSSASRSSNLLDLSTVGSTSVGSQEYPQSLQSSHVLDTRS